MQKLQILNTREKKALMDKIRAQWGCDFRTDLVVLKSSKDRIYLATRDFERIDTGRMRVDSMGNYFATLSNDEIRLSIEGSQMVGPLATKNVLELDKEHMRLWLKGNDLELSQKPEEQGYVLLRCGNDFLGTGRVRDRTVLSFVPKNRRILAED